MIGPEAPGQLRHEPPKASEPMPEQLSWWVDLPRDLFMAEAWARSGPMSSTKIGRSIQPTVLPW